MKAFFFFKCMHYVIDYRSLYYSAKNVSNLVSTCRELNFLIVDMTPHWKSLTCF